jgi:nitroreductase
MTAMAPDQLLSALQWRYATKQFDSSQIIPEEAWNVLEQSLRLTPSSFGLQPWKFLVVNTPSLREKLRGQSWNQSQVTDASHLVVFAVRTDVTPSDIDAWITCLAEVNGKTPADLDMLRGMIVGFSEAMTSGQRHEWNKRQAYIALGQLMAAAAVLGIDACPLEGIHAGGYDEILGLASSGYSVCVACALGYRDASDPYASAPKARFARALVIETL